MFFQEERHHNTVYLLSVLFRQENTHQIYIFNKQTLPSFHSSGATDVLRQCPS